MGWYGTPTRSLTLSLQNSMWENEQNLVLSHFMVQCKISNKSHISKYLVLLLSFCKMTTPSNSYRHNSGMKLGMCISLCRQSVCPKTYNGMWLWFWLVTFSHFHMHLLFGRDRCQLIADHVIYSQWHSSNAVMWQYVLLHCSYCTSWFNIIQVSQPSHLKLATHRFLNLWSAIIYDQQ